MDWDSKRILGLILTATFGLVFLLECILAYGFPDAISGNAHNAMALLGYLGIITGILLMVWKDYH